MIFFDIDATLLDHEKAEQLAASAFFINNLEELPFSKAIFVKRWFDLSIKYFDKFLANEISFQEQRRFRIKELFGNHLTNKQADDKFNEYLAFYKENWSVFEDVIPCLDHFKAQRKRLGIISNGDYNQQIEKLTQLNILNYFDCIVSSSEIGISKPKEAIFTHACEIAEVQIHETFYIGDRLDIDAISSSNAGMKGIWLNRNNKLSHPDVIVIHNLSELSDVI
ncbi:HAD family hydrolase [Sutcliffiella rhizosphaerae]|uniref:Phosphoglycolate phosphatase n=1 Tax=Sutcliffiella rhizosphaerae TaxID=2880967 RepID=A0ABN8AGF2_9BACI|nr:HAD family hydrolase [Sutcliffiella rhizosphaerae]CAG9623192.1 Phosphoglycolate phosphatase [Sutcliffiella rhizosphaerae]